MRPALDSLANGLPYLIFYLLVVTAIFIIGLVIYTKLTPHKELELVQNGNMAASKFESNTSVKCAQKWLSQTKMPDNAVFDKHLHKKDIKCSHFYEVQRFVIEP